MSKRLVINSIEQLRQEFKLTSLFSYPNDFEIDSLALRVEDKVYYNQQIKKLTKECGCSMGKVFLGSFIFLYLALLLTFVVKFPTHNHFINCISFALLGGFIGKSYGLVSANLKIYKLINEIENKIKN